MAFSAVRDKNALVSKTAYEKSAFGSTGFLNERPIQTTVAAKPQENQEIMTIKLKDLARQVGAHPRPTATAKQLFRGFVADATSPTYRGDPFWEELRQKTTPNKFKTVPQMFARWQALAGIKR